jgi:hypothetical protein
LRDDVCHTSPLVSEIKTIALAVLGGQRVY